MSKGDMTCASGAKFGDIAVRIGTYTSNGVEKGRYATIGALMLGEGDSYFGSLHAYIDLAALHQLQRADCRARGREIRDSLAITVFERRDAKTAPAAAPATGFADLEEVPF